ncbi:heavy metal translocating P-type ATPase [Leptospira kanakyensis]|uniref:heavy metal translocating P-type ATPase n=1 Tax=Leptospira kanakyensis TaxID=2484968 RepID=UPI002AC7F6D4|nr:heavy metal translocating P-type ATPase [Leptospira kanakyensis]
MNKNFKSEVVKMNRNQEQKHSCCAHDDIPDKNKNMMNQKTHDRGSGEENHHDHENPSESKNNSMFLLFLPPIISSVLLGVALAIENLLILPEKFQILNVLFYILAYLPVGFPVLKEALKEIFAGDPFSEFFLMSIATIGAFSIGEYPEGVAVMLFYSIGEVFQNLAVRKAKLNIKNLMDQRPDIVTIVNGESLKEIAAELVAVGDVIQLKPGEKLALDSILISDVASFDTAALTGESKPDTKVSGDVVFAGMINLTKVSRVKVTTPFVDSKLSKILELVQDAVTQKAPTELFMRKFAKIYTPIVVLLSIAICLLPYFLIENYLFRDWLYRALIFLVISCPCALVISIPLGYFGGIGAASRKGILFKGSHFLDTLAKINMVVMDKTGTITKGEFKVNETYLKPEYEKEGLFDLVNILESHSSHPIAVAVNSYFGKTESGFNSFESIEEIPGHGMRGIVDGKEILAGNQKLLEKFQIPFNLGNVESISNSIILISFNGNYSGYISIADTIKPDANETIEILNKMGVDCAMLSGDKASIVTKVAAKVGIKNSWGDLLPEDKVRIFKELKNKHQSIAFVGDGINDAPVIALSDVGLAMGGLGSDAAIETADVVIQDDQLMKIPMAIWIGKETKKIVFQNISLAFAVKLIVLLLGAGGIATMWEAVFADVGVSLLAILNAVRIQNRKFSTIE